jgi:hypothetical protein
MVVGRICGHDRVIRVYAEGTDPPRLVFLRTAEPSRYTIVYTAEVQEQYHFEEDSYEAVAAAGTDVVSVLAVLHGRPQHRRHVGSTGLIITGRAPDGRWLMVGLLEKAEQDDVYVVAEVRFLSAVQAGAIERRLGGEVS